MTPSSTNSSGPPASVVVTTGFRGEERLERHVAVILVVGREDDGERARVQIDQLPVVDAAGPHHPVGDARLDRGRLERSAQRPLADDDEPHAVDQRERARR